MNVSSSRSFLPLMILSTIAATGLVIWFLWKPLGASLVHLRQQQMTSERDAQIARSRAQALQSLSSKQADLQLTVGSLSDTFAPKEQPLPLIQQLEAVGQQTHTEILITFLERDPLVALQPIPSSEQLATGEAPVPQGETPAARKDLLGSLPSLPVEVKVTGSYHDLVAAIRAIETLSSLNEVRTVDFAQPVELPGSSDRALEPSATLSMRFFVAP